MWNKAKRGENYMGFLAICWGLSFAVCVSSIVRFNLFSIICGLILVSANSLAIGYNYGRRVMNEVYGGEVGAETTAESAKSAE